MFKVGRPVVEGFIQFEPRTRRIKRKFDGYPVGDVDVTRGLHHDVDRAPHKDVLFHSGLSEDDGDIIYAAIAGPNRIDRISKCSSFTALGAADVDTGAQGVLGDVVVQEIIGRASMWLIGQLSEVERHADGFGHQSAGRDLK